MGYSTLAYGIDIDRLRLAFGSNDQAMMTAIETTHGERLRHREEGYPDGTPTLGEAVEQILKGEIEGPEEAGFQYGYATQLLCRHLGHELDNEDLIAFIDDLEIPTGLLRSGPPLPIPPPRDFPVIGFLTAGQVRDEYDQLKDQDLSHEDEDIEEAREEFRSYLRQAHHKGLGIVTFAY